MLSYMNTMVSLFADEILEDQHGYISNVTTNTFTLGVNEKHSTIEIHMCIHMYMYVCAQTCHNFVLQSTRCMLFVSVAEP